MPVRFNTKIINSIYPEGANDELIRVIHLLSKQVTRKDTDKMFALVVNNIVKIICFSMQDIKWILNKIKSREHFNHTFSSDSCDESDSCESVRLTYNHVKQYFELEIDVKGSCSEDTLYMKFNEDIDHIRDMCEEIIRSEII